MKKSERLANLSDLMGSIQGGPGIFGQGLAGLGQSAQQAQQQQFGTSLMMREQQMHAQQQMNEIARAQLDALKFGRGAARIIGVDMAKVPDELLTIRQQLQKETDTWLASVTIN